VIVPNTNREGAWKFLKGLEQHLGRNISPAVVREFVHESKGTNYEFDFVNAFMLPSISEYLRQTLSPADAVKAFLAESVDARNKGLASGTPAGANRHPLYKGIRCVGQDSGGYARTDLLYQVDC
jgi:hypothetical protein